MNTKIIFGIIIVLVLIVGGFVILSDNSEDVTIEENSTEELVGVENEVIITEEEELQPNVSPVGVEVLYTNNGFEPKEITISKGQTVTWVNNSSRNMWVASAFHPTHTTYPEKSSGDCSGSSFDSCVIQQTGGSYSFTFNEIGSWKYHNHVQTTKVGTVIVE